MYRSRKEKITLTPSIYKYHSIYMNQSLTNRASQQHFVKITQGIFSLRLTSISITNVYRY